MWFIGEFVICFCKDFMKFYNLLEWVFFEVLCKCEMFEVVELDWFLCEVIDYIVVGMVGEIQCFWDVSIFVEIKEWLIKVNFIFVEIVNVDKIIIQVYGVLDIEVCFKDFIVLFFCLCIVNFFDFVI